MNLNTTESIDACDLTVIILTFNEEIHIERCIKSISKIAKRVVVLDSYSTDKTLEIASSLGADIYSHTFTTYALQFNWALDNVDIKTKWVMRLDADEYLVLGNEIILKNYLLDESHNFYGYTLNLRRIFMGKWLRYGSLYPIRLLRVWRFKFGRCENRLMDEHILVDGAVKNLSVDFADHNLNSLTWWTDKHNKYACREVVDLLNIEFGISNFGPGV